MQLTDTRKITLAGLAVVGSTALAVYLMTGSAKVGPPFRDEALTAGPDPLLLLNQPAVQKELRLSKRQIQQLEAAVQRQFAGRRRGPGGPGAGRGASGTGSGARGAVRVAMAGPGSTSATRAPRMGRKHEEAFVSQLLAPQQLTRLHQIILQQAGGLALASRQMANDLGLTPAQRRDADAILAKLSGQLEETFQQGRGPEGRQQAREARQAAGEQMLALLTPEQETRWRELTGQPFTGELTLGPRGFAGGGAGRGPRYGGRRGNARSGGPNGGSPPGQPPAKPPPQ
jgi:hypothetical protein